MLAPLALLAVVGALEGTPEPASSIDKEVIRKVIRAHAHHVRACYVEGLVRRPELQGRVVLRFVIARDGSVESSEIAESELDDAKVEGCIAAEALRWRFPLGGTIGVSYPFTFVPERDVD
jgi:hypothetical protein